jgi:hypothetical protein
MEQQIKVEMVVGIKKVYPSEIVGVVPYQDSCELFLRDGRRICASEGYTKIQEKIEGRKILENE